MSLSLLCVTDNNDNNNNKAGGSPTTITPDPSKLKTRKPIGGLQFYMIVFGATCQRARQHPPPTSSLAAANNNKLILLINKNIEIK